MINFSIKSRVLLLAILPALIITILVTAFSSVNSLHKLDQGMHRRGRIIAMQLASASEYGTISGSTPILQNLVQQTMTHEDDIQAVLVTDNAGRILAVSGKPVLPQTIAGNGAARKAGEWKSDGSIMFSAPVRRSLIEIDDYAAAETESLISDSPRGVLGQVYVVIATADLEQVKHELVGYNLLIALGGLTISGLVGWRSGRSITRPVQDLAAAVDQVAGGKLDIRIAERSGGELGTLERGFNHMTTQLGLAHDHLQKRIDEATQKLSHQANHDPLTGLINRREFETRLERSLRSAREHNLPHVFCYMDLDQFKIVNDTCGHRAGDTLLQQLSLLLTQRIRERDTLARLGGDEFGLLLENCSVDDARMIAEALRKMVHEFRFIHEDKIFDFGVSIGMVAITSDTESVESIMSAADAACFAAKDNGRNRIHVFEQGDDELARRHGEMQWVSRLTRALETDSFRLYCQPIMALAPHVDDSCYCEILVRKIGQHGKLIPPMAFIPAAERFHLMGTIDRWVIRHAFATYSRMLNDCSSATDVVFTINLSGVSLSDTSLLPYITEQFALHGVPPAGICFEITETAAIVNLAHTVELITALKASGCRFLLDDFGSGMSSFAYLKNLPVDFVKIDGTFVRDIVTNPIDLAMVQSIHSIANAMQIKTIAEFVECAETVSVLSGIGVHYGQGFHLGRPMPIEQMIHELKEA